MRHKRPEGEKGPVCRRTGAIDEFQAILGADALTNDPRGRGHQAALTTEH